MGDGVAMFDETPRLAPGTASSRISSICPTMSSRERPTFADYIRYLADAAIWRGAIRGADSPPHRASASTRAYERTRPDGRAIEIRRNPVPGGGFVLIYADITERKRNEAEIRAARDAAEEASRTIEAAIAT